MVRFDKILSSVTVSQFDFILVQQFDQQNFIIDINWYV